MVRLKAYYDEDETFYCDSFNSSMVRLKVISKVKISPFETFQFLDGAIKREKRTGLRQPEKKFQFLDGAIKSLAQRNYE